MKSSSVSSNIDRYVSTYICVLITYTQKKSSSVSGDSGILETSIKSSCLHVNVARDQQRSTVEASTVAKILWSHLPNLAIVSGTSTIWAIV